MDTSEVGKQVAAKAMFAFVVEKSINPETRTLRAMGSTGAKDRMGEIIEPAAFAKSLETYRQNPVIVAGHNYSGMSGEPTVIGKATSIEATVDGLPFEMQFAQTPLANQYWDLYQGGFMRAFSVGFIPKQMERREEKQADGTQRGVRVYTEVELLEISAVAVPANAEALMAAGLAGNEAATRALSESRIADLVAQKLATLNSDPELKSLAGQVKELLADLVDICTELRGDMADPKGAYLKHVLADDGGCQHGPEADAEGRTTDADRNHRILAALNEMKAAFTH